MIWILKPIYRGGGIENDPMVLKSARRVYATDCVYVYGSGRDTVCRAEAGTICLKDTEVSQGFEIIQDIFDFYDDWYGRMWEAMRQGDYQTAVDDCWQIFHNPMVLLDASGRVMGIDSHYQDDPPDQEWKYLLKYGCSSVSSIQVMKADFMNKNVRRKPIRPFRFQTKLLNGGGIGRGLYQDGILLGRIVLLEKDRAINHGDYQIMKLFADCFLSTIRHAGAGEEIYRKAVFARLLKGEDVDREAVDRQLSYYDWEADDVYQVILARVLRDELEQIQALIKTTLENTFSEGYVMKLGRDLILIWNVAKNVSLPDEKMESFARRTDVAVSKSLPLSQIQHISYMYRQAQAGIRIRQQSGDEKMSEVIDFYQTAVDFMLLSGDIEDIYHACHPDVMMLWKREKERKDELFETFAAYASHDFSIKSTCESIFIHRNTLIYRIRKIMNLIQSDISDSYTKHYMVLSVRILRIYENLRQERS